MVAESPKSPVSPVTPKKKRADPTPLPLQARLKVRNLYLSQGLGSTAIAAQCGLSVTQVQNLVSRLGLSQIRRNRENGIIKSTDTRAQANLEAFNQELAEQAEEISLGALQRARGEIENYTGESPRNFQSLTGGIANLVKASRSVRGLDAKGSGSQLQGGGGPTLIFVGALERVTPTNAERAVTEVDAIEVREPTKDTPKPAELT